MQRYKSKKLGWCLNLTWTYFKPESKGFHTSLDTPYLRSVKETLCTTLFSNISGGKGKISIVIWQDQLAGTLEYPSFSIVRPRNLHMLFWVNRRNQTESQEDFYKCVLAKKVKVTVKWSWRQRRQESKCRMWQTFKDKGQMMMKQQKKLLVRKN